MAQNSGKGSIPRYYSVWRVIWSRIMSGHYPAGSLIGTEVALAEEFGVSRVTLREALSLLEGENLVDRRRSQGTFVAAHIQTRGVVEFTGYLEDIIHQVDSSATTVSTRAVVPAPPRAAAALEVAEGEPVVRMERLRVAHGEPRLWLVDYLPCAIGESFSDDDLNDISVLRLLDSRPDTRMGSGNQIIHAEVGDADICKRLEIPIGSAVFFSERMIYDSSRKPISYAEMYYPGDRFSFDIRLARA